MAVLDGVEQGSAKVQEGGKRSSWRVWLGSWRARRGSRNDLAAVAAAAVEKADMEDKQKAAPQVGPSLAHFSFSSAMCEDSLRS